MEEDFKNKKGFIYYAYLNIESDFLDYLYYVPLREEHEKVSSMKLAEFIIRSYPLLSMSFRILTFGNVMKSYIEDHLYFQFGNGINEKEELFKKLLEIYKKKEINKDTLNDYYKFYNEDKIYIKNFFYNKNIISNQKIKTKNKISSIKYDKEIEPFTKNNWNKWKNCRNEIAHRGKTEATLKDVLNGIACLAIIIDRISMRYYHKDDFISNLFEIYQIKFG